MTRYLRRLFRWIPVAWKARLEYYFDNSLGKEFGGPFNGQVKRQAIFKDVVKAFPCTAIIETGTFRGVTTEFMARESGLPVYTVEYEPRFFHYAKLKLKRCRKVHVSLGDSRDFINQLVHDQTVPKSDVFIYLDAHWDADLPLYGEIETIGKSWKNAVIMIDDFAVPDDAGYQFDDYGDGKCLSLKYISPLIGSDWSVFFPAANSEDETGLKRGSVLLVSKDLENEALKVSSLRLYESVAGKSEVLPS